MRVADSRVIGIFPLQHKNFTAKEWDLQLRASIFGMRIVDRLDEPNTQQIGHWLIDEESVGDIHGGQLWKQTPGARDVPMWRFATPILVKKQSSANNDVATPPVGSKPGVPTFSVASGSANEPRSPNDAGFGNTITDPPAGGGAPKPQKPKGGCRTRSTFGVLPVYGDFDTPDFRFKDVTPETLKPAKAGERAWPKFPGGSVGISLTADFEEDQIDLYHPTDPRLVSVNFAGDKGMGSLVFDLDYNFNFDGSRGQHLQSLTRVIKKPLGKDNVLAWQLGMSGCKDTEGGHVIDDPTTGGQGAGDDGKPGVVTNSAQQMRDALNSGLIAPNTANIAEVNRLEAAATGSGAPRGPNDAGHGNTITGQPNGVGGGGGGGGGGKPPKPDEPVKVVALASRNRGGPFDVGSGKCRHALGMDADGNPVVRLHWDIATLFRQDDARDGPLHVTDFRECNDANRDVLVHFGWRPKLQKWDWYTTTYVYYPDPPHDIPEPPHNIPGDPPGTITPGSPPSTGNTVTGGGSSGGTGGGAPLLGGGGSTGGGDGTGGIAPSGGGAIAPGPFRPGTEPQWPGPYTPEEQARIDEIKNDPNKDQADKNQELADYLRELWRKYGQTSTMQSSSFQNIVGLNAGYLMTDQSMGLGEILAKPYNYSIGQSDFRNIPGRVDPTAANKRVNQFPVTGNMAAFGAQGGTTQNSTVTSTVPSAPPPVPAPPPPAVPPPPPPAPPPAGGPPPSPPTPTQAVTNVGATGDPFDFTHKPGKARYMGGTANGGWVILPPEVGLEMIEDGLVPKAGVEVSETYFGVGPGAKFFAAIPDLAKGRPADGVSWGVDTSNGDLIFNSHFTGGDPMPAFRMGRTSQRFGFKSRTQVWGNFAHFNQLERTWTMPDQSGTVVVATTLGVVGTGDQAILGKAGPDGPTSPTQWGWGLFEFNGTTFKMPLWI